MQVGQKVVCVDDVFPAWAHQLYAALPVKGVTYTIREVSPGRGLLVVFGPDGKPVPGGAGEQAPEVRVLVVELVNPPDPLCKERELGFRSDRFAPIEESESELTEDEPELASIGIDSPAESWRNSA